MKTSHTSLKTGAAVAATVAALFATGSLVAPTVAQAADSVQCFGVNSCKGHGACKTASNDCKGMNACKGQGWEPKASKAECESAGGHVMMDGK
jgi:uncharacterized membrane protein